MAAFDRMPKALREFVRNASLDYEVRAIHTFWKEARRSGESVESILAYLRECDEKRVGR